MVSAWNLKGMHSNNPEWENDESLRCFNITPAELKYGPIQIDHKYTLKLKFRNRGNFTARARLQPFKPEKLCTEEENLIWASGHTITIAPGCCKTIGISLLGRSLGHLHHVLKVTTERKIYEIPMSAEVMDQDEHAETVQWNKLQKKMKASAKQQGGGTGKKINEIELIANGDEGVGDYLYDGDKYTSEISNAYLNSKWDEFSKRVIIDHREKWVLRPDVNIDRKTLEDNYNKTFKTAKSKWTSFKDRFKTGGAAKSLFKQTGHHTPKEAPSTTDAGAPRESKSEKAEAMENNEDGAETSPKEEEGTPPSENNL